jgi:hypothetical protein
MSRLRTIALAATLVAITAGAAAPQSRIQAGVLECLGLGTTGFIIGSVHDLECVFRSDYGMAVHHHGLVRKFGLDLGYTEHSGLTWAVFAPTRQIGPGDLAGYYVGVSAGASVGLGLGANALIGGSNSSFALQPLSVEGQSGINLAIGVADLELRFGR